MTEQNTFMEVVQNVAEIVRTAEVPMTEEEILAYFSDMDLDANQKQMVLHYIMTAEERAQEEQFKEENEKGSPAEVEEGEEESESRVFRMYLEELAMLPSFTAAERQQMYEKLAKGNTEVIETISTAWLKKVLTIAEKYMDDKLSVEDLVQEGNMALFLKLQELLGCGDSVVVEECLTAAVEEGIMEYCSMMNGKREQEDTLVGKVSLVQEARKLLAMEKGDNPTLDELAEYTRMSREELEELTEFWKD